MRIGLVCPYSFDVHGGVQNHVLALAADLVDAGHHVGVLAPGDLGEDSLRRLPAYVSTVGRAIPLPYNGAVGRVSFGPLVAARVRRWLAANRFDVVHLHEPVSPSVSLLALWAARAPVVATFHAAEERPRTLQTSAATVLRPALAKIGGHIAVSPEARAAMERYLAATAVVIPNGVRTAELAPPARTGTRRPGPPTLVFVGRLDEPRKGLDVLLRALPAVVRRHPDVRVVLVGAGSRRNVVRGLDPGVAERVVVAGPVDDRTKVGLLADADVLVAPNTHGESFGIVLVEAMAARTAVVASDLPAFRRVLGGGSLGALSPPGDSEGLAATVDRLLADPGLRRGFVRRAAAAAPAYDWSEVTPRVLEVYRSVLDAPREVVAG